MPSGNREADSAKLGKTAAMAPGKLLGAGAAGGSSSGCSMASPTSVLQYDAAMASWELVDQLPEERRAHDQLQKHHQVSAAVVVPQLHDQLDGNGWEDTLVQLPHHEVLGLDAGSCEKEAESGGLQTEELPCSSSCKLEVAINQTATSAPSSCTVPIRGSGPGSKEPGLGVKDLTSGINRVICKPPRGSRRVSSSRRGVPTTVLDVSCTDFRQMVEELTGVVTGRLPIATSSLSKGRRSDDVQLGAAARVLDVTVQSCRAQEQLPVRSCVNSKTNSSSVNYHASVPSYTTPCITTDHQFFHANNNVNSLQYSYCAAPPPVPQQRSAGVELHTAAALALPLLQSALRQLPNYPNLAGHESSSSDCNNNNQLQLNINAAAATAANLFGYNMAEIMASAISQLHRSSSSAPQQLPSSAAYYNSSSCSNNNGSAPAVRPAAATMMINSSSPAAAEQSFPTNPSFTMPAGFLQPGSSTATGADSSILLPLHVCLKCRTL